MYQRLAILVSVPNKTACSVMVYSLYLTGRITSSAPGTIFIFSFFYYLYHVPVLAFLSFFSFLSVIKTPTAVSSSEQTAQWFNPHQPPDVKHCLSFILVFSSHTHYLFKHSYRNLSSIHQIVRHWSIHLIAAVRSCSIPTGRAAFLNLHYSVNHVLILS